MVYGDNAAGKSLIGQLIEQKARQDSIAVRSVSVRNRTRGGIEDSLIFGDQGDQSTGATSISAIQLAIKSMHQDDEASIDELLDPSSLGSRRWSAIEKVLSAARNASKTKMR